LQGGIAVGAEALTLNGSGISSGGALRNIGGTNTYSGPVTLGSASRINSDSGTLILNNAADITGATFGLTLGGAGNINVGSVIGTTTGTLTKDGTGRATLLATNTYTGVTTISNGVLAYGVSNAIATNNSVFVSGGTLDFGGYTNTLSSLRFNGGVLTNGALNSSSNITITNSANTTNTIATSISGGTALTNIFISIANNATNGVTILSGSNSYTGITELNGGTIVVANNYAFGEVGSMSTGGAGGNYIWLRNAALDLNGMTGIVETLVMSNNLGYVTNSASTTAT
jgi:autotransporter-associated beta strand protein